MLQTKFGAKLPKAADLPLEFPQAHQFTHIDPDRFCLPHVKLLG